METDLSRKMCIERVHMKKLPFTESYFTAESNRRQLFHGCYEGLDEQPLKDKLVTCPKINLNKGGMGISFQFHHPKDARACNRPHSGQRSVDRHKKCLSLWRHYS